MKYVMLIYMDEKRWEATPVDEKNRVHEACGAWHMDLERDGKTCTAAGLQPTASATTIREKDGKVIITDGPFAETKEALCGFEILECDNLDEAIAIARRFPSRGEGRCVEIRPLVAGGQCKD